MAGLPVQQHPKLIVGLQSADDAGVYRLNDDTALIQTVDFFTPIVNAPYDFGRIAAANALSDIYAMGGEPITAMNIVCFPADDLPESVLRQTLEGGLDKIHEAGAALAGGHSVDDREFKYGLSVTGIVHPEAVLTNSGADVGDRLILTKPIGTGILATAVKGGLADAATGRRLIDIAAELNKSAACTVRAFSPSACTDITGFGLAGHLFEMAAAAGKVIEIEARAVPLVEAALSFGQMGLFPAGAYTNKDHFKDAVAIETGVDDVLADMMFDPQTSGGLVVALPPSAAEDGLAALQDRGIEAAVIGEVTGADSCGRVVIR